MAKLMIHRDLLSKLNDLPAKVRKKVADFVGRFQADPHDPALRLHPLKETIADDKVRGAELPGGYRAIIVAPTKGDTYLLVYIDSHDKAYQWARHKRFEVHEATCCFQVFDLEWVKSVEEKSEWQVEAAEAVYPLALFTEDELFHAGVPLPLVPAVKDVKTDQDLESLSEYLPRDCHEVLFGLAAGMSLDEALSEMLGLGEKRPSPEGPGDFTVIDEAPNYDLVLVEGEDQLREILQASLEEWRIFLHPYQRKMVDWRTTFPIAIRGAAGTGKTVALLHRAARLAREHDDPKRRILLTTFTTNLAPTLEHHLRLLAKDHADVVDVTNLHKLARSICEASGWTGRLAGDKDMSAVWGKVWKDPDLGEPPMSQEELRKELDLVIEANGIEDLDGYLTTVRSGRPRISRRQRRDAWPFFRAFQRELKRRNLLSFEGAIHQARLAAEQGRFDRYVHVLVDEVQDFSLEAMRLVAALAPLTEEDATDPLCVAGDGHQRIYRTKVPLSRAGIHIRGRRSCRLKINYRTTEENRLYAQGMLEGADVDDLDGGTEITVADRSLMKGAEPEVETCTSRSDEYAEICAWIKGLTSDSESGFATHEVCVATEKYATLTGLGKALEAEGIQVRQLRPREKDPGQGESGVRLATMHRIKGLEFRAVALACADRADAMNDLASADAFSRSLRYVAATRARERLLITLMDQ